MGVFKNLSPHETPWRPPNVDEKLAKIGYNTRVIAFIYDTTEYNEEVEEIERAGMHLSAR